MIPKLIRPTGPLFCAAIIGVSTSITFAQSAQPLQVALKALRVTISEEQKETLLPAEQVKPGDIVEYQATYTNTTSRSLKNLQATVPIPTSLEYMPESAKPANVQASLDGKNFSAVPLVRKTLTANGQQKTEAIPLREYRFLRWNVGELGARKSIVVSARARVSGARTPAKASSNR